MATGNRTNRPKDSEKPSFQDFKFVPLTLTEDAKKDFKKWAEQNYPDTFVQLDEVVNDGIKVSINWDDTNSCYIVSFTCLNAKSLNYCLVLTSRSDTILETIALNLYKHRVVCKDGEWPQQNNKAWG